MPRGERPLDDGDGPLVEFAAGAGRLGRGREATGLLGGSASRPSRRSPEPNGTGTSLSASTGLRKGVEGTADEQGLVVGERMVLVTRFRTQDLPVAERFSSWYDRAACSFAPSVLRSDHEADFRADAQVLDLGGVQVSSLAYPSLESRRLYEHDPFLRSRVLTTVADPAREPPDPAGRP